MLPRERVQIALEGGQPDRVPFLLECDYDYMARAAGREPWEYIYADSLEQARIHEDFYRRHPSDLWKCWGGPPRRVHHGNDHRDRGYPPGLRRLLHRDGASSGAVPPPEVLTFAQRRIKPFRIRGTPARRRPACQGLPVSGERAERPGALVGHSPGARGRWGTCRATVHPARATWHQRLRTLHRVFPGVATDQWPSRPGSPRHSLPRPGPACHRRAQAPRPRYHQPQLRTERRRSLLFLW